MAWPSFMGEAWCTVLHCTFSPLPTLVVGSYARLKSYWSALVVGCYARTKPCSLRWSSRVTLLQVVFRNIRMFAIYQVMLGWKTYTSKYQVHQYTFL